MTDLKVESSSTYGTDSVLVVSFGFDGNQGAEEGWTIPGNENY